MNAIVNRRRAMGGAKPPIYAVTAAESPKIMARIYEIGGSASPYYCTIEEASNITISSIVSDSGIKNCYEYWPGMHYFTGTSIPPCQDTHLKGVLRLPSTITGITQSGLRGNDADLIIFPEGLTSIQNYSVGYGHSYDNILNLIFLGETPPSITDFTCFGNSARIGNIYVPDGCETAYYNKWAGKTHVHSNFTDESLEERIKPLSEYEGEL